MNQLKKFFKISEDGDEDLWPNESYFKRAWQSAFYTIICIGIFIPFAAFSIVCIATGHEI